jgi:hypothetical protein
MMAIIAKYDLRHFLQKPYYVVINKFFCLFSGRRNQLL